MGTTKQTAPAAWAGVDIGKGHHWVCVIDHESRVLFSEKVVNDEEQIRVALARVSRCAHTVTWAVDILDTPADLLLAVLREAATQVRYVAGRVVNTMSTAYRGEGKTDARDAFVIAETCRVRRDLPTVEPVTDQSRQLEMLVARRADLVADRVRLINRLRDLLTSVFPTLEREFNFAHHKGAVVLLTGYADPQRIRRVGVARLTEWLRRRHIREAAALAARAVAAANAQRIHVPGKDAASAIASELAADILALDERLHRLDTSIAEAFRAHPQAPVIESMPGFGPILGAMLLAAVGDFRSYPTAGHLAAAAGLVPVPNDSGRRVGNLHRPRRYSRTLRHVLYLAAFSSLRTDGPNKTYYDKKRAAGRTHKQALIALSRRRCDVLWALLRDGRCFALQPPARPPQAA